jgi:hypothetical protein
VRWLLPPWSAFVLFEREGGGGGGHVSMANWNRLCIPTNPRRGQVARSKAGSCEVYAIRGLSRVGTTPIRKKRKKDLKTYLCRKFALFSAIILPVATGPARGRHLGGACFFKHR